MKTYTKDERGRDLAAQTTYVAGLRRRRDERLQELHRVREEAVQVLGAEKVERLDARYGGYILQAAARHFRQEPAREVLSTELGIVLWEAILKYDGEGEREFHELVVTTIFNRTCDFFRPAD